MQHPVDRRHFLYHAGLLLAGPALLGGTRADAAVPPIHASAAAAATPQPDLHPFEHLPVRRIAFGSCAHQDKEQPIWDAIIARDPDLFIFLGDNIYGDTRDMTVLREKYAALAAKPGFRRLRERTPILAIWDDHDYGENDAGTEYPLKEASRQIFCDFFGESADSPRRTRDGIYAGYCFGPADQRVQILLPDLRFNRTPILTHDLAGTDYEAWAASFEAVAAPVPGPYARNPARDATMLGERQWAWLQAQLQIPATVRILASSLQVVADFPGWEAWINYPRDRDRLIDAIRRHRANGLFCISGDTHWGELSCLDSHVPYPLWDLTSSGLTETWPVLPPNANRIGAVWRERNFGLIDIDWRIDHAMLSLRICDESGEARLTHQLDSRDLRTPAC
jgi:alkaline phosphatase D